MRGQEEPTEEELKKMEEIKSQQGNNLTVGGMPSFNLHNDTNDTLKQEVKETVQNEISQNNQVSTEEIQNEKETNLEIRQD